MKRVPLSTRMVPLVLLALAGCGRGSDATAGRSGSPDIHASIARGPVSGTFTGLYVNLGEGPLFTECETGRGWRVQRQGLGEELDQAYLAVRSDAGSAARVTVEAHSTRSARDLLVIDKVVMVSGETVCPGQQVDASLTGTTWRMVSMGDRVLEDSLGVVTLRLDGEAHELAGATLCHSLTGIFEWVGTQLTFGSVATSDQRCSGATASAANAVDASVLEVLRTTGSYSIHGDTLSLMGETGVLARLTAQG